MKRNRKIIERSEVPEYRYYPGTDVPEFIIFPTEELTAEPVTWSPTDCPALFAAMRTLN